MAQISPTAMIFIPCRDGISHRPDEFASTEAIGTGTRLLAEVLRELAG
jgi:ureidoglycolate amidohydrolase